VWHGSTVLQHGSFNFARDVAREARAFRLSEEEAKRLESGSATLDSALGRRAESTEVVEAVVGAFRDILGVSLVAEPVSEAEKITARELLAKVDVEGTGLSRSG
jgi:lipoate-protein ligase A